MWNHDEPKLKEYMYVQNKSILYNDRNKNRSSIKLKFGAMKSEIDETTKVLTQSEMKVRKREERKRSIGIEHGIYLFACMAWKYEKKKVETIKGNMHYGESEMENVK